MVILGEVRHSSQKRTYILVKTNQKTKGKGRVLGELFKSGIIQNLLKTAGASLAEGAIGAGKKALKQELSEFSQAMNQATQSPEAVQGGQNYPVAEGAIGEAKKALKSEMAELSQAMPEQQAAQGAQDAPPAPGAHGQSLANGYRRTAIENINTDKIMDKMVENANKSIGSVVQYIQSPEGKAKLHSAAQYFQPRKGKAKGRFLGIFGDFIGKFLKDAGKNIAKGAIEEGKKALKEEMAELQQSMQEQQGAQAAQGGQGVPAGAQGRSLTFEARNFKRRKGKAKGRVLGELFSSGIIQNLLKTAGESIAEGAIGAGKKALKQELAELSQAMQATKAPEAAQRGQAYGGQGNVPLAQGNVPPNVPGNVPRAQGNVPPNVPGNVAMPQGNVPPNVPGNVARPQGNVPPNVPGMYRRHREKYSK